jgi:hypothetical protein
LKMSRHDLYSRKLTEQSRNGNLVSQACLLIHSRLSLKVVGESRFSHATFLSFINFS